MRRYLPVIGAAIAVGLCLAPACSDDDGTSNEDCGDNIAAGSEVCDGEDLQGQTCTSQGFSGGVLACNGSCSGFDVSGCTNIVCSVDYCDDLVTYCSFAIPNDCGGWGDYTMQECIDGLIVNFSYCGYPANIASCLADCSDESVGCYDLDDCSEDHDCSWFGDCP
jgi:hypothetical protein